MVFKEKEGLELRLLCSVQEKSRSRKEAKLTKTNDQCYYYSYDIVVYCSNYVAIHCKKLRVISTQPWLAQLHLFRSSLNNKYNYSIRSGGSYAPDSIIHIILRSKLCITRFVLSCVQYMYH